MRGKLLLSFEVNCFLCDFLNKDAAVKKLPMLVNNEEALTIGRAVMPLIIIFFSSGESSLVREISKGVGWVGAATQGEKGRTRQHKGQRLLVSKTILVFLQIVKLLFNF